MVPQGLPSTPPTHMAPPAAAQAQQVIQIQGLGQLMQLQIQEQKIQAEEDQVYHQ